MSTVATAPPRPLWRRLIGFNLIVAIALGVGGFFLGWFIGDQIQATSLAYYSPRPARTTSRCCSATGSAS